MLCSEGCFIYIFHPCSAVFILKIQHQHQQHHHHPHPHAHLVSCFLTQLLQQTLDLISTRPGLSVDQEPNTVIRNPPITIPLGHHLLETFGKPDTDISPVPVLPYTQGCPPHETNNSQLLLSLKSVRPQTSQRRHLCHPLLDHFPRSPEPVTLVQHVHRTTHALS
jgi:hypothetical protein